MKKINNGAEGSDLNILSCALLSYTRVNTMKRIKYVNQGGHLRYSKLCICLNGSESAWRSLHPLLAFANYSWSVGDCKS